MFDHVTPSVIVMLSSLVFSTPRNRIRKQSKTYTAMERTISNVTMIITIFSGADRSIENGAEVVLVVDVIGVFGSSKPSSSSNSRSWWWSVLDIVLKYCLCVNTSRLIRECRTRAD